MSRNPCLIYKRLVRAKPSWHAFVSTKEKLLELTSWRGVQVFAALYWFERWPQLGLHRGCIILANRQAAALFGPAFGESSYDEVATDWQGSLQQIHVVPSVIWIGDEVKHRSIVPDVELAERLRLGDVGNDPFHCDARSPSRALVASRAVCEISSTATFAKPASNNRSTRNDWPPPTSSTRPRGSPATWRIKSSDCFGSGSYQLTSVEFFVWYTFSQCCFGPS